MDVLRSRSISPKQNGHKINFDGQVIRNRNRSPPQQQHQPQQKHHHHQQRPRSPRNRSPPPPPQQQYQQQRQQSPTNARNRNPLRQSLQMFSKNPPQDKNSSRRNSTAGTRHRVDFPAAMPFNQTQRVRSVPAENTAYLYQQEQNPAAASAVRQRTMDLPAAVPFGQVPRGRSHPSESTHLAPPSTSTGRSIDLPAAVPFGHSPPRVRSHQPESLYQQPQAKASSITRRVDLPQPVPMNHSHRGRTAPQENTHQQLQLNTRHQSLPAKSTHQQEQDLWLTKVRTDPTSLESAPPSIRNDKTVILEGCRKSPNAIQYATKGLLKDKSFIMQVCRQNGLVLEFLPSNYKSDKQVVLEAVQQNGFGLHYCSEPFRLDPHVVLVACQQLILQDNLDATGKKTKFQHQTSEASVGSKKSSRSSEAKSSSSRNLVRSSSATSAKSSRSNSSESSFTPVSAGLLERLQEVKYNQQHPPASSSSSASQPNSNVSLWWSDPEFALEACDRMGLALRFVDSILLHSKDFMLQAIQRNPFCFQHAPDSIRGNKELVLSCCKKNGLVLRFVTEKLRNDHDVVWTACQENPQAMMYASEELQYNHNATKDITNHELAYTILPSSNESSAAPQPSSQQQQQGDGLYPTFFKDWISKIAANGLLLEHAPFELRANKEFVIQACQQNGWALQFASEDLQGDTDVVMAAIKQNGTALRFASKTVSNEKVVVLKACEQNGLALKCASTRLRADKDIVIAAVTNKSNALKFALGGLNQDPDCLVACGLWDEGYQSVNEIAVNVKNQGTTIMLVLSTRFSLAARSRSKATQFAVLLKQHAYISGGNFFVYSPNAFGKSTCDPEWTRFDWPCRGTFGSCFKDPSLKLGVPQPESCWRYSFRYQLERARKTKGFMIQLVEATGLYFGCANRIPQTLGDGQKIETQMAGQTRTKVFQVHAPIFDRDMETERETGFKEADMEIVIKYIQDWYNGDCEDMSVQQIHIDRLSATEEEDN